jgi:hypothetical protein
MRTSTGAKTSLMRLILAMLAGIVAWILVAMLFNIGLRFVMPGYAVAEPDKSFTLAMLVARLVMGALASLAGGAAAGWIDRPAGASAWIIAAALLAAFIPAHVALWLVFPVWYHLTFLVSLAPLTLIGSMLVHRSASVGSPDDAQQAGLGAKETRTACAVLQELSAPSTDKADGTIGRERPDDLTAE